MSRQAMMCAFIIEILSGGIKSMWQTLIVFDDLVKIFRFKWLNGLLDSS